VFCVAAKKPQGGLAVTGGLNLGGSLETMFNPITVVETAIEKGASSIRRRSAAGGH
jgi:ATP-dependent Lon protease